MRGWKVPGVDRLRATASVEWPIFWRARYEIALLILAGMAAYLAMAPAVAALDKMAERYGAGKELVEVFATLLVFLWLGALAIFWLMRQTELSVPAHATRAVSAPSYIGMVVFVLVWIVLAYVTMIRFQPLPLLEKMKSDKFASLQDSTGLAVTVVASLLIAAFFKARSLFGAATAAASMAASVAVMTAIFLVGYLYTTAITKLGFSSNLTEKGTLAENLVACSLLLVVMLLCWLPALPIAKSFAASMRTPISRFLTAVAIWNSPYMLLAVIGLAFGLGLIVSNTTGFTASLKAEEATASSLGIPEAVIMQIFFGLALLIAAVAIEVASRIAARLLTLPEK